MCVAQVSTGLLPLTNCNIILRILTLLCLWFGWLVVLIIRMNWAIYSNTKTSAALESQSCFSLTKYGLLLLLLLLRLPTMLTCVLIVFLAFRYQMDKADAISAADCMEELGLSSISEHPWRIT